jgi:hypothetical protein
MRPGAQQLRAGGNRQDLATFVKATSGTNSMRHVGGIALRAFAQLGQLKDAVIRTTHALTTGGRFTLGNTHKFARF